MWTLDYQHSAVGRHVQLRVRKKEGKEAEDVLDADSSGHSVWGKLWGGKQGAHPPHTEQHPLHRRAMSHAASLIRPTLQQLGDTPHPTPMPGSLMPPSVARSRCKPWSFAGEVAKGEEEDDRVHVFTVASGHMYERLQKIMILSVLRTTKCVDCLFDCTLPHHTKPHCLVLQLHEVVFGTVGLTLAGSDSVVWA